MAGLFKAVGTSSGFQRLPEGHHILQIRAVEFDPDFFTDTIQQVEVVMATENGITHKEKFNVATVGGSKAFTYLVKTAHNRYDIKEGDSIDELVDSMAGLFIETVVKHEMAVNRTTGEAIKTRDGQQVYNVKLDQKKHSTGWSTPAFSEEEVDDVSGSLDGILDETEDFTF